MSSVFNPRIASGALALLALAGCSSLPGGGVSGADPGDTFGNILAFRSPTAPPVETAKVAEKVNCPIVDVSQGGAAVRVGGGSNSSVRYQYSMGDLARECAVENGQIVMRVGVEGKILLGPSGSPGTFTVPVKVQIRRESDEKIIETKIYRVAANVPAGAAQGAFSVVSDTFRVPFISEDAFDDYQIFVSFDGSGGALPRSTRRRG